MRQFTYLINPFQTRPLWVPLCTPVLQLLEDELVADVELVDDIELVDDTGGFGIWVASRFLPSGVIFSRNLWQSQDGRGVLLVRVTNTMAGLY